jgi:putative oxidoreductase
MRKLLFGTTINPAVTDSGLFALRVFAGLALLLAHGLGKIPPTERFVASVGAMGFPAPIVFAWAAGLSETIGGALLALGLATRPSALFILFTMATAGFIRHAEDPFLGKERALLFMMVALLFLLAGAGRYSIDAWIQRKAGSGGRKRR